MDWKTRIAALLFWIFIVLSSVADGNAEKKVVCYYTNWSVYRPGTAKFSPQNINPYLCTHLIYAFGGFTKENTLKPFDKYQDIEKGGYAKFTGLKTYNKDLKTMVAIGGWNEGSSRFSPMVADPQRRKEFVKNTVKFLRQNHFDGLDLDWEYPAFRDGGKPRDKNNYADLVQELRQEFERESSKTGRPRLLLSMAVPAGIEYIDKGYDVPRLNEFLDFVNLLSYDYHSAYEPAANHHSPLYPLEEDNEYNYDTELTIDYTITHLLKSGASPEKIILGIPTYGRSYTLFNEDATDIGAPADGPGEEGDATREKGYLAYYEICESIAKTGEWQVVQPNPSAMGPYAYRGNQWVGYDDEDIVRAKARYVNEKKLGGIMFWSIDNDDFRGKCHGRPYPLIEAAKEAMLTGDEKSHSGTKTRVSSTRKKSRNQAGSRLQVDSISRKSKTDRRTTTEASSTRRRISTSRSNGRFNGKARGNGKVEDNEEDDEEEVNSVKSAEKPRSRARAKNTRSRNQSLGGGRKKLQNSRYNDEKNVEELEEETRSHKLTTPEPPTTPDPGSDFKCEDEGFFPHPRDCKKYFWCLDSGPSGLGIVGHQFTCPSGLVFNKAADSCDYARNVVCPKAKVSQNALTTTKAPITAATSRTTYLHKPTHRTTTPKDESEEEYEYYDDEDEDADDSREIEEEIVSTTTPKTYKTISRNRPTSATTPSSKTTTELSVPSLTKPSKTTTEKVPSYEDEEDPRVIKELIDLIKKAGGIEQLEKQLLYQDKNSGAISESTAENGKSTPATISRSLYERVLNRQATRIAGGFLGSFSTTQTSKSPEVERSTSKNSRTGFINGPGGAQFEGLDQVPEVKTLRRTTKHQYVTIERQRQTTSESPAEDEEEIDEEDENVNKEIASSEDRAVGTTSEEKPSNRRFTPSYVNIRRSRPSTATSENDVDLKEEGEESGEEENEDLEEEGREEPPSKNRKVVTTEEETSAPKPRYTNVQRFRSSTSRHSVDEVTEQVSLRNDLKTSSTSTSTTTEKTVPVTEEITEDPTTPPATSSPVSSSSQTPIEHKFQNATVDANSKEASSTPSEETTKISSESALRLVENSATEILFTTVPASSVSLESNYDSFTRGPTVSPISQPRPFGFSRRGRPTTTAIPPTTATPVTEQTRTKVSSKPTRNFARSSSPSRLRGARPRSRLTSTSFSTTESHLRDTNDVKYPDVIRRNDYEEKHFLNDTNDDEETLVNKSQFASRRRGVNRYTPPTYRVEKTENQENTLLNKRTRPASVPEDKFTTESSFVEATVVPIPRGRSRSTTVPSTTTDYTTTESSRKYSRPSRVRSTTTPIKDSPIIRINPQVIRESKTRGELSHRDDEDDQKITNIRVFDSFDGATSTESTREDRRNVTTPSSLSYSVNSPSTLENLEPTEVYQDRSSQGKNILNAEEIGLETVPRLAPPKIEQTTKPIRRKVLRQRRPVTSSTTESYKTSSHEISEDNSNPRKRKIVRRLRPSMQDSTSNRVIVNADDSRAQKSRNFSSSAIPTVETSGFLNETAEGNTTNSRPFMIIVESPEISDPWKEILNEDNSTSSYFDTRDGEFYEEDSSTLLPTTIIDAPTDEPEIVDSTSEIVDNPENAADENDALEIEGTSMIPSLETLLPNESTSFDGDSSNEADSSSTESPTTLEFRATTASSTSTIGESRFVRKKFVYKRPSASSFKAQRFGSTRLPNRPPPSTQSKDLNGLSDRRKNLFVRRRPVISTTTELTIPVTNEETENLSVFDDFHDSDDASEESTTEIHNSAGAIVNDSENSDFDDFWKNYTLTGPTESTDTATVTLSHDLQQDFTNPISDSNKFLVDLTEDKVKSDDGDENVGQEPDEGKEEHFEIKNYRKLDERPVFQVPQSLKKGLNRETTTESSRLTQTVFDSAPEESAETKLSDEDPKVVDYREPRARFGSTQNDATEEHLDEDFTEKFRFSAGRKDPLKSGNADLSKGFWRTQNAKNRVYRKRLTSTTEQAVTETLIPAKKFDYVADAQLRKQQSLKTTQRYDETTKMLAENRKASGLEDENSVETDFTTASSSDKPQITRLVTSVVESGTTERQIIHIKTKYSSLTSTARIPVQNAHNLKDNYFDKSVNLPRENNDEFPNEIRESTESTAERSTLSIEGEFALKNRFTTESTIQSSTIEIESVFNNLIPRDLRSVVMYRYDFQVDEETLRLPTLKELVGFTKTLSNHVTSEFTESPTTNLIVDTTVGNNELRDESDVRLLGKDQLSRYDLSKGGENSSASGALPEESNVEKDTLDNDILSSEEIQRRSSATSFVHSKQTRNDGSTYDRDKNPISSKEIGTVEVPVTILDHTGGEEIAELVLLRVPENRFHSAILKPVFRVKILEQDNESALNDIENTRKAGKLEVFPESSSENELPNNSRTTYGKRGKIGSSDLSEEAETTFEKHQRPKNRPHNRQRIVKARRRTRPLDSLRQNDEIMNVSNSEPGHSQAQIIRISRRRENTDKSATETTTSVPESFENLSNTIVPTTLRGNYSLFSKVSNVTRGFYITRTIDETSTTSDPITTEYWNDPSDDTTLDFTTQNYDFTTRIIEPTTSDLDTTVQTEETGTPVEITVNFSSSSEESSTVQSTSTLLDAFQTSVVDQQLTASLGAVISESLSTETDEIPESTSSWDPKTEKNPINEPEITTFRPRTTKTATTSDGTIPTKSATTGFTVNSLESTDNNADLPNSGEANDDVAQPLDIENSDRISSTTGEPKIVQIEKVPTQDEQDEARTRTLGARSATVSSKITSNRSGTSSTTVEKSKVESTTIPMRNTVYELDTNVKSEAERSSHGTNNFNNATVTISRAGSRRGGVRYTTTAKSPISSDGSSLKSRSKPQKSANGDSVLPTDIITTKSYDATVRNSANQKATQTDPSSLPPSSTPSSRRRGNGKVSTRPLRIAENKSSSSKPSKLQNIEYAVTEDYNHNARSRVHNQPTYSTTNYDQTTVNRAQTLRGSPHGREGRLKTTSIDEAGRFTPTYHETSSISSTEFYEKAIESPEGNESPHSTMNSEQEIVNSLNAAQRISKDSSETQETSEPSSSQKNMDGTSKTPRTFPNNSSETQDTSESFKSHKSINDTSEAAQPFSNDSNKTQETNESLNFYKNINGTSDPKILHELVTEAVTEAYDRTTLSSEALPTTINYETTTTSSSVTPDPTFPVLLNDQETTTTISTLKDLISPVTPPESDGKTLELTMLTDPTIDLITSTVEPTESGILSSQVPGSEITNLPTSNNSNGNVESIKEAPTKILATTDIYEETKSEESTTLSTESTTLESESNTFSTNIDTLDKITESIDSVDTSPPYEVTTSEAKETTYNYEGTSFSVNQGIRDNESEILINTNDGTTKTTMEISQSTTVLYATDDRDEFVTNSADIGRKKVANLPGEAFEDIPPSIISDEQKSYILNKVSEKSTDKTIKTNTTNEKIKSRGKELFLQNDVVPSEATSTTSVYENFVHSTTDVSSTRQASTVEPQMKRPRGRVRFTSFAGSSNDADEQNRRPIKQVVVRRRPAKDRRQNATSLESNSRKSEIASSDINRKTHRAKIQSRNDENSNVKDEYESTKNVEIGKISDENARRDHARITNELNDQRPGEKTNSPKTTRRRVVVYRGRPRPEKIATTAEPVTTTSTTPATVQSSSSSTETLDNKKRRRHKWRKRLVLKRSRVNVEEEDQSIAESGDFRRVFINDRYVENSPDEITTPHIFMPDTLERSSEHEDIAVEASPFKTTGAFLRRPGTLVRNDALKRLRSNVPSTSVPTILPSAKAAPFAKIVTVDPTYEMKTEDQSVRAQEVAVTLSDPPAVDTSPTTGRVGLRTQGTTRKISTTVAPRTEPTSTPRTVSIVRRRQNGLRYNNNLPIVETPVRPRRPAIIDYDYYVDDEIRLVFKPELKDKLFVTKKGGIRCLDQGNFAHPTSCKKFITCARMVNGQVIGTEYTCPDKLSFDPVGGICNWSAGLGCEEKSN
ncbi:serine-rich adhesin for platelets-like [Venturia canescens]|uniref:serine-rich adhesin for platelets-like n=1 Tax=Venturia canescens TaxID=32260 RepID=UPI001C9C7808|nr:serine-rich adhesin for platelets-like [Venturia canescens]